MKNRQKFSFGMFLVTIGIVYGDIGTSPMYVMKSILEGNGGIGGVDESFIIGSLSLVIWTITLLTTIKYVLIAMKADNHGEGGIFSLYSLVKACGKWLIVPAMLGGAALLADGVLTPAVTVTTAVEGLRSIEVMNRFLGDGQWKVVVITLLIITTLFSVQHAGTSKIGKAFGPVMLLWFSFLGLTGLLHITALPAVLKAFNPLYAIMSVAFLLTLFGNGVSWAFGVNSAAFYAARQGNLPHWFGIESKRTHMAIGASVTNGAVASVLVVMQTFLAGAVGNVFWALFSMQLVFEMTSYIPMFPAMLKLRAVDPDRHRPFRAPGSDRLMRVLCWLPVAEIVLSMVATIVPLNASPAELSKIPALIGVVLFFLAGEVVRVVSARGRTEEYKGLTPELAAARNAQAACDAEPQTSETEGEE